jgi:hypothetical protein
VKPILSILFLFNICRIFLVLKMIPAETVPGMGAGEDKREW